MCPLHPFKAPIFFGNTNPSLLWAKSKTLHVVKMFVSSVLSFFIIHFKVRVIQNFNLSNFLVSLLALTTIIFHTDFSVFQESFVHGFFKANDQVWINFKLFVRNASTPCCYYLEIISIFAWSSLQNFVTCKAWFNFSLVQYFWRLKSQLFFSRLMINWLFVCHGFNILFTWQLLLFCW